MSAYIIPIIIVLLIIYAVFKKINVYQSFVSGAKQAIPLVINTFPYIASVLIAVELFKISGLYEIVATIFSPIFNFVGIPNELTQLTILRPFTGSGSLAILNEIYIIFGVDSYIARVASVIMGSSETVFYVTAVYFSATNVKKTLYAIPVALFACFLGAIAASLICLII